MINYLELAQIALDKNKELPRVYTFTFNEQDFIGLNTVFAPIVYEDTFFFIEHLPILSQGHFLEIGCGTGLISVNAAKNGFDKVVAIDINPDAVRAAKLNAVLHHVEQKMDIFVSNVFDNIENTRFDIIFWNAPFLHQTAETLSFIEKSVMGNYLEGIAKYIATAKSFLTADGKVLLGFSSTCGDIDLLNEICETYGASLHLIAKKGIEEIEVELFEVKYQ